LWLGTGLAAQRQAMGEAWLDGYLNSPAWRFVLMPGAASPAQTQAMAGVLMASVDRVGRYFPLTLAAPLPVLPGSAAELEALLGWLHRLEDVAVDAVQDDWTIEQLEDVLGQLAPPVVVAQEGSDALAAARQAFVAAMSAPGFVAVGGVGSRAGLAQLIAESLAGRGAEPAWLRDARRRAIWLADIPGQPKLLVSLGLPGAELFAQMLGASGREPGESTIF